MKFLLALITGIAWLFGSPAFAITDEEGNASIQFNFSPPGARSLAMAGAFIALADDATAAYSNPAGLMQLAAPEVSMEVRQTSYKTEFVNSGAFSVDPFGVSNIGKASNQSNVNDISFLSFVMPRENWAVAIYHHKFLDFETEFSSLGPIAADDSISITPFSAVSDVESAVTGLSAAYKVNDDFAVGLSLNRYEFDIDSNTTRVARGTDNVLFRTAQQGQDIQLGYNFGARYQLNEQLRFGLVYRRAPKFTYDATRFNDVGMQEFLKETNFDTPDLYGIGAAWRPFEVLTLNLDLNYITYGDLTGRVDSNFVFDDSSNRSSLDPLKIRNGLEVRLGSEYTFTYFKNPFSVRAGVWYDPAHSIQFRGTPDTTNLDAIANAVLFSTGGNQMHVTAGLGWAFEKFQIDAGIDCSSKVDTFSLSAVARF